MDKHSPYGRPALSRREKMAMTVASVVLLAVSVGVAAYMIMNKPRPERRKPTPSTLIVSVQQLSPSTSQITVPANGTVMPASEVDLKSRVGGEVVWTNPEFVEGGIVDRYDPLVRIDSTEYELALTRAKASYQSALLELKTEQGRQEIARSEWEILGLEERATELDRELALRQPQIAAIEARLEAARADVKQAELNLERTVIRAPFNAVIISATVNQGAQVTAQSILGKLAGSDRYHVEALLPMDRLEWIHIPEKPDNRGSRATVTAGNDRVVDGLVFKLLPDLQPGGLLSRVIIVIEDPLDLTTDNAERRPLLLGDYVTIQIQGRTLDDVFTIEREHLKDGSKVYIADEGDRLEIRDIKVLWSGAQHVLARGLNEGDKLIISDVPAPVEGMELRVSEQ